MNPGVFAGDFKDTSEVPRQNSLTVSAPVSIQLGPPNQQPLSVFPISDPESKKGGSTINPLSHSMNQSVVSSGSAKAPITGSIASQASGLPVARAKSPPIASANESFVSKGSVKQPSLLA